MHPHSPTKSVPSNAANISKGKMRCKKVVKVLRKHNFGNKMWIIKFNNGLEQWDVKILQSINYLSPQENSISKNLIFNVLASLKTQTHTQTTKGSAHHSLLETK